MIGVLDSGLGGLVILRTLTEVLPEYAFAYLGDNARAPYGPRTEEEIFQFTRDGIRFLFKQGCLLVILGCNTMSAGALRRLQREWLPMAYPDRRVLGIIVPTVEVVTGVSWMDDVAARLETDRRTVAVFATQATVDAEAYAREIRKRSPSTRVIQIPCPRLAPLIESGAPEEELDAAVAECATQLKAALHGLGLPPRPDTVVLGCTHYGLIGHLFKKHVSSEAVILDQGHIVADRLISYLKRHPELDAGPQTEGTTTFYTTGDPVTVSAVASRFYGETIQFEHIS